MFVHLRGNSSLAEHRQYVQVLLTPRVSLPGWRAAIYLPVDLDPYGYCLVAQTNQYSPRRSTSAHLGIPILCLAYFVLLASSIKNGLSEVSYLQLKPDQAIKILHTPKAREQVEGTLFLTSSTTCPILQNRHESSSLRGKSW